MQINVTMPFDKSGGPDDFQRPDAVTEIGKTIERAGFAGACVTDHPVPTGRWLDVGGHHAQDPFVMLSFIAAATKTVRLQTGILVLPYRNPFITARSVATLDVFSNGRVTLGVGAGYLKGEYKALGVNFELRNELMDEYILAMKAAWTADEFTFEGTGYQALGNRILPRPAQRPHPPILIGGNSKRAIRRAVDLGDAWYPFFTAPGLSTTSRTKEMTTEVDLDTGINYLREYADKVGKPAPEIHLSSLTAPGEVWTPASLIDKVGRLKERGISAAAVYMEGDTVREWCDNAERFGADVLKKL
jgi:probable F420-dependent oxidoreductase